MLSDPVAGLLERLWPTTDPDHLRLAEERFGELAQRLSEMQVVLGDAARDIAATGDGRAVIAMTDQAHRIADVDLAGVIDRLAHHATATRAYGDAVAEAQERLTVVAAIADRDLLAGQVLAAATGDTTGLAGAQDAAARVMTAAAGQLDWRTREIADDLDSKGDPERGESQSGAGAGAGGAPMMAPMGGVMAGALAGAMAQARGADDGHPLDVADVDLAMLRSRAAHLAAVQPSEVAPWIRLAVGLGVADGRHVVVVGTSELGGYLRPGTSPEAHEVVVGDGRAPELAIMSYFTDHDIEPLAICAATPPPAEVAAEIAEGGTRTLGVDDGSDQDSGQ